MITFKLKFLLAFSTKTKDKLKRKEKPNAKKTTILEVDPPNIIRLEKNFSAAHVEYELIPGKCKYQFDVLCWHNAAKIYTADGVKVFKTITRNGLTFVPVCVNHQWRELSMEDVILLQSSIIEFNVFTDKNKLGYAAKSNQTEVVYLRDCDSEQIRFVEAFAEKLNRSVVSVKKSVKTLKTIDLEDTTSRRNVNQKNEVFSQMLFEEDFAEKLYEIINFVTNEEATEDLIVFKDFVRPYNPEEDKVKTLAPKNAAGVQNPKAQGKKEKKEKAPIKLVLQMQAEVFFTDPNLAIFRVENNKFEVAKFFVLSQVENLLTRTQKIHLNPIVIKTMHISNFPVEIFENTSFTGVYCKYSIPCIAECKTNEKPIKKIIGFNESHIYFTHTLSKIKLLEFLETKRLVLEIYGIKRGPPKETDPKLFGEKKSDKYISKYHTSFQKSCLKHEEYMKSQDELLAYCSYDLSSLLKNVWDFREKAQLHNVEHSNFLRHIDEFKPEIYDLEGNCDFWFAHHMSTNSINLARISDAFKTDSTSLLKEWILMDNNTSFTLEAYLLSPQAPALVLHQIPNTYKRLFVIAIDRLVATNWYAKISNHNQKILCQKLNTDHMLTGWALDNGNNVAIFVEGLAIGYILNLWQELDNYSIEVAKVFFNTDQAYEKRLYPICNKWSGFYILTLKVPLEYILKDQRLYLKGNAPIMCLKALTKLNLLFYTRTLKLMIQYDLFPTIEELTSLDLEYGVPFCWKTSEPSEVSSIKTDSETIQMEV